MKKLVEICEVENEKDFHQYLKNKGFSTNYKKEINANGYDIVAIKNGYCFHIEIKRIVENKTTKAFKFSDNSVKGDILLAIMPDKKLIPIVKESTSLTKTIRFLKALDN